MCHAAIMWFGSPGLQMFHFGLDGHCSPPVLQSDPHSCCAQDAAACSGKSQTEAVAASIWPSLDILGQEEAAACPHHRIFSVWTVCLRTGSPRNAYFLLPAAWIFANHFLKVITSL